MSLPFWPIGRIHRRSPSAGFRVCQLIHKFISHAIVHQKPGYETIYLPSAEAYGPAGACGIRNMVTIRPYNIVAGLALALVVGVAALVPQAAQGAASGWGGDANARGRLIAATEATGTTGRLDLGLEFQLAPGWHLYSRAPGDTGPPPGVASAGSRKPAAGTPAPARAPPLPPPVVRTTRPDGARAPPLP